MMDNPPPRLYRSERRPNPPLKPVDWALQGLPQVYAVAVKTGRSATQLNCDPSRAARTRVHTHAIRWRQAVGHAKGLAAVPRTPQNDRDRLLDLFLSRDRAGLTEELWRIDNSNPTPAGSYTDEALPALLLFLLDAVAAPDSLVKRAALAVAAVSPTRVVAPPAEVDAPAAPEPTSPPIELVDVSCLVAAPGAPQHPLSERVSY